MKIFDFSNQDNPISSFNLTTTSSFLQGTYDHSTKEIAILTGLDSSSTLSLLFNDPYNANILTYEAVGSYTTMIAFTQSLLLTQDQNTKETIYLLTSLEDNEIILLSRSRGKIQTGLSSYSSK